VTADIQLPGWYVLQDVGEAALDYPLPAQSIAPFLGTRGKDLPQWKPVDEKLTAKLAFQSKVRVAKDAKFAKIIKENKESADKMGIIQLDDFSKKMKKEGVAKETETRSEQKQKVREQYAPYVNESVNILLDMVTIGAI